MKRTIKLIAAVLAATAIGVVANDRSRAHEYGPWFGAATFQTSSVVKSGGYRIEVARRPSSTSAGTETGAR